MLTPAQQAAVASKHHTAVIANAGSGKTRVLVEKYITILLSDNELHPRDVVAITFSDASARDLREKMKFRIDEMLTDEQTSDEHLPRLRRIRDEVQLASISTIHSFCGKLLRAYPMEAGVDATFGILRSPEDGILRDECITDTLYETLQLAYKGRQPQADVVLPLIRTIGRQLTARILHSLIQSRYRADRLSTWIERQSDPALAILWSQLVERKLTQGVFDNFDNDLYASLFDSLAKVNKGPREAIDALQTYNSTSDTKEKLRALSRILSKVHNTGWEAVNHEFVKHGDAAIAETLLQKATSILPYRGFIESIIGSTEENTARYTMLLRNILFLYQEVRSLYDERKNAYSLLDYDDMLLKALKLFSLPQVTSELTKTYRYILVDEYQDTDDIQFDIIRSLTYTFASGQLIIVGDPKQSIYRFRNANIELFNKTVLSLASTDDSEQIILQESFRMLAAPLAFINRVFSPVFSTAFDERARIDYAPLILGRKDEPKGSITLLRSHDDEDGQSEPELIAAMITELVRGSAKHNSITNDKGEKIQPSYRDIAILLRSRNGQSKIEEALRQNNIPFLVHRGSGFYMQQEIIDIVSYLRFLLNTADDIALMGILRSPFFAISDDVIVRVALQSKAPTLWEKLTTFSRSGLQPDQVNGLETRSTIEHAFLQLLENVSIAGRTTPSKIIRKIFDETGIYATYKALPNGDQMIANIEKFASIIVHSESTSYSGLFDLVERLNMYMEKSDQEALADISTENDAVNILTIHGAKGLEFPIVFLPFLDHDLGKSDPRTAKATVFPNMGIPLKIPGLETQPPVYELMKLIDSFESLEEEKRILYVAMTRAREHLFLSLTLQKDKTPTTRSYAGWIGSALETDFTNDITISTEIVRYDDQTGKHTSLPLTLIIPFHSEIISVEQALKPAGTSQAEKLSFCIGKLAPSDPHVRFSPTQLLTYVECPTKYYLRYDLGIPEDARISFSFEPADQAEFIKGTIIGQLVHAVFEKIDRIVTDGILDEKQYTETLSVALERLAINPEQDLAKYSARVLSHIRAFLAHKDAQAILSATSSTELPLRSMLSDGKMLSGIIDRLYQNNDGGWTILDYKTDRIFDAPGKMERYEFQMKFYAYLVKSLYPEQSSVRARLFFTNFRQFKDFTFTEPELATVGKELDLLVAKIRTDKTATSLSLIERNRTHCPDCPYFDVQRNVCLADHKG